MTTILPEQIKCPECSRMTTGYFLHSDNNFGADEPFFIYRGYVRCPWCGHHIERDGAIEFLSDDPNERQLQLDPRFEPEPEKDQLAEGETEVTFGKWIPGTRRPEEPFDS